MTYIEKYGLLHTLAGWGRSRPLTVRQTQDSVLSDQAKTGVTAKGDCHDPRQLFSLIHSTVLWLM